MSENISNNIGCFTADFRNGRVIVGGKAAPSGFFFMNSLNEYWKEYTGSDKGNWLIGNRLKIIHNVAWNIQDDLTLGYIDESKAMKLHESITYILNLIAKIKPFRYLNPEEEQARCDDLFSEESVKKINDFLKEQSQHTLKSEDYWLSHLRPNANEIKQLSSDELHFRDYLSTFTYYYELGNDMNAALDFGKGFVEKLSALEKRNENNLVTLAMDCMKQVPFETWNNAFQKTLNPNVEYVEIPKKPRSKNFVIGKRMRFDRFLDFLVADFFEGLHDGHYPSLCENCGRYYLKTNARHQKYCTGIDQNDIKKRTCHAVAAAKGRVAKELSADHPIKSACENRLKTIRTHVRRGKITEEQAAAAARIAQNCRDKALYDVVYANTHYKAEISQDSIYDAANIKL